MKFKIIIAYVKDVAALQIIVYSKPINLLKKIFIDFKDFTAFAKKVEAKALQDEKSLNAVLNR
jgi:hypothetical protein